MREDDYLNKPSEAFLPLYAAAYAFMPVFSHMRLLFIEVRRG